MTLQYWHFAIIKNMENPQRKKVRFHYAPNGNDIPVNPGYTMSPETRQRFVDAVAEGFGYTIPLQQVADLASPISLNERPGETASDPSTAS